MKIQLFQNGTLFAKRSHLVPSTRLANAMKSTFALLALIFFLIFSLNHAEQRKRVCYIVAAKDSVPVVDPISMDWSLCTHVIYAFAEIRNATLEPNERFVDYILGMNATKPKDVKAIISVGGPFEFARNQSLIDTFVSSVIKFCTEHNVDGIDVDWEFPHYTYDKDAFSMLLVSFRKAFDSHFITTGHLMLFSVAISPILYIVDQSYDIPLIDKNVDFVNVMTYDYHTPNTLIFTSFNSPLYPTRFDLWYFKFFNVNHSVSLLESKGLQRKRIVVGIPFYGYLYYLSDPQHHSVYSVTNGTQNSVFYSDVCYALTVAKKQSSGLNTTITRVFDPEAKVPYVYSGRKWITFDDVESVTIKSQWIVDRGLGGSMTFALNYDDIHGDCGSGAFALQRTITDILL